MLSTPRAAAAAAAEGVIDRLLETRQRAGVAQAEDPDSVAAIRQRQVRQADRRLTDTQQQQQ